MSRAHTGDGQRFDQHAQRFGVADELFMARVEFGELALESAGVAQPQHRAAADGAAVGLDGAAGERHQLHGEAFAVGAQRIDGVLHRLRLVGLEPRAERQHALRHRSRW